MKRLLIVSDFASPTGFATVSENIARNLKGKWEIDVLAINYHGDPHPLQKEFNIFPASLGGDVYGLQRIASLVASRQYQVIFMLNDMWIINEYMDRLKGMQNVPPIVFYTPVDAKNIKDSFAKPLNRATYGIFYTEFGANEVLKSGFDRPYSIIPHGIDEKFFHPIPKTLSRKETGIPDDWFVVLMCQRNQPRKRLDLGLWMFSEWVKDKPENIKIYYHGALRDIGWDIEQLAAYFGIGDRLIVTSRNMTMNNMLSKERLKYIYTSSDVFFTPCAAEGLAN